MSQLWHNWTLLSRSTWGAVWASLDEAFTHIKTCLGSGSLALHDLLQDMRESRLSSAMRTFVTKEEQISGLWYEVDSRGTVACLANRDLAGKEEWFGFLTPEFWWEAALREESGSIRVATADPFLAQRPIQVFIRRAHLDRCYPKPVALEPAAPATVRLDDVKPPERRRGPVLKHDWHAIDAEIARRCIDPKTGRVQVPKSENKLADNVLDWLANSSKN